MSVSMEFVLVTGGGGFLGQYLVQELRAQGIRVRSFSRARYPRLDALDVEQQQGDIRDAEAVRAACQGVDTVFHTVAIAGIWGPWQKYYDINTLGTRHVINACREHRVARLVYTSSPSVTFAAEAQEGVDETEPYPDHWLCAYPRSKALAEQDVLAANGPQLATCSLRPHLVWGPHDPHLVPRLIERARRGRLRRVGDGRNLVDMIYVENAAAAHVAAAQSLRPDSPVAGRAYFISQGEPVRCWEWIDEILSLAGLQPVRKSLSFRQAWAVGKWCERVYGWLRWTSEPPMTRFLAAQLALPHYFNIGAAVRDFGYTPRVATVEGMQRLGDWLRSTEAAAASKPH